MPSQDWLGEHLQNDLFCVEWDAKTLTESINQFHDDLGKLAPER